MALPDHDEVRTWLDMEVVDRAGRSIGRIAQVYTDDATGVPEWALARLGNVAAPVPLVDAVERGGQVRVTVLRDEVMLAPPVRDERHLAPDEEERLYRHYGIAASGERSRSLLPVGEGPEGPERPLRPVRPERPERLPARGAAVRRAGRGLLVPAAVLLTALLLAWARVRRRPIED